MILMGMAKGLHMLELIVLVIKEHLVSNISEILSLNFHR